MRLKFIFKSFFYLVVFESSHLSGVEDKNLKNQCSIN